MNNTSNAVDRLTFNEAKFVEMKAWLDRAGRVAMVGEGFRKELASDGEIIDRLQANFRLNVQAVRNILDGLKGA